MRTSNINKLISLFGKRSIAKGLLVFALIVSSTLLEIIGIGMIFPFLQLLSDPGAALEQRWLRTIYDWSGAMQVEVFLNYITAALVAIVVFKSLFSVASTFIIQRILKNEQAMLSSRLVGAYLAMPWEFHIRKNSALIVRNTMKAVQDLFGDFVNPFLTNLADALLVIAICCVLLAAQPFVTLLVVGAMLIATLPFYGLFKEKARKWGIAAQHSEASMLHALNEGLGSLKETKLAGRERFFHSAFSAEAFAKARNYASLQTVITLPRNFVEIVLVAGIVLVIVFLRTQGEPLQNAIPTLGLFALAAFRLVPPVSRLGNGFITMKYGAAALEQISGDDVLDRNIWPGTSSSGKLPFRDRISLQGVEYHYPDRPVAAVGLVNFDMPRGLAVALVGPSGAGKTTLVDLILGLLEPSAGVIKVDGHPTHEHLREWQNVIGYVPQTIYLRDDSLRRNIAFGIPDSEVELKRLEEVIALAGLEEVLGKLPDGLDTRVGERGVSLSGGQRQRIGIARALYGRPELLVLDEATSALDGTSEHLIARALERMKGNITMIVIAHRLSTIQWCDQVVFLKDGVIRGLGRYDELLRDNEEFRRFVQVEETLTVQQTS